MKQKTAILGCGNMGTALALVLAESGRNISLYSIEDDVTDEINNRHRNTKYLADTKLPKDITATGDIKEALRGANMVIFAVPSFALQSVTTLALPYIGKNTLIGCITKGFDSQSSLPLGLRMMSWLPLQMQKNYCLIGGPAIATELAHSKPSAIEIASENPTAAKKMAQAFQGDTLKAATTSDLPGVAYAMALKNIYAIGLGLCEGLKYPMNTKALIMTQAIMEMGAILKAIGAKSETAMSLAGLGDLIVTSFSTHGRNRTYGEKLVGARTKDPKKLGLTTVEGIAAAEIGKTMTRRLKLKAPLMDAICKCLAADSRFEQPFKDYLMKLRLS
ncbi:MAG: NAD(P)H-dependent glycerol-3-phosphate dehydrogenase [Patescibacteria group bacterium]|nr:NAD(P)H-dependent glycerol-3-phosphate dehydrogenase [Patescibacteria group bacterium]